MEWQGFFDGASRGNPGTGGAGAVLLCGGRPVWQAALPVELCTNNEAEYTALGLLLREIEQRGLRGASVFGDSQLVIRQVTGAWKIKEPRLAALAAPLIELAKTLGVSFRWVPREQNALADRLSNRAIDEGELVETFDVPDMEPVRGSASYRQVASGIWLVEENGETYAVDRTHGSCTCPEFAARGRCRHFKPEADD